MIFSNNGPRIHNPLSHLRHACGCATKWATLLQSILQVIMQIFSADTIVFKKKKKLFDPENMKKLPSKVAHNRPPTFFLCTGPAAQTA